LAKPDFRIKNQELAPLASANPAAVNMITRNPNTNESATTPFICSRVAALWCGIGARLSGWSYR